MSKIKLVVEIDEERYKSICDVVEKAKKVNVPSWYAHKIIANGIPLDNLRAEIDEIEINGHIRDVECFSAGINTALNVIDKYMKGEQK